MIANPVFLVAVCTLMVLGYVTVPVGVVIAIAGYAALWQLVRIARRDVAAASKPKRK